MSGTVGRQLFSSVKISYNLKERTGKHTHKITPLFQCITIGVKLEKEAPLLFLPGIHWVKPVEKRCFVWRVSPEDGGIDPQGFLVYADDKQTAFEYIRTYNLLERLHRIWQIAEKSLAGESIAAITNKERLTILIESEQKRFQASLFPSEKLEDSVRKDCEYVSAILSIVELADLSKA